MHATRRSAVGFLSLSLSLLKVRYLNPIPNPTQVGRGFVFLSSQFFWLPETPFQLIIALDARKQGNNERPMQTSTMPVTPKIRATTTDGSGEEPMRRPAAAIPELPGPFLA
jgi:hypothetical protein